jgi:hypothetical protein
VSRGHRLRWHRRRCLGRRRFLLTQGTVGLVGEACKRLGVLGALTPRPDGLCWLYLGRRAWAEPGEVQHDQIPPIHLCRQWSLKPTGFFGVKLPLGRPHFSIYAVALYYMQCPRTFSTAWDTCICKIPKRTCSGWSLPGIGHRVRLHQPNAIARIAGGGEVDSPPPRLNALACSALPWHPRQREPAMTCCVPCSQARPRSPRRAT